MKWCTATIAFLSLAGLTLATTHEHTAEVYALAPRSRPSSGRTTVPHLPRQLVRHILLQRMTNGDDHSSLSADLPDAMDRERALDYLSEFGRPPLGLFGHEGRNPSLVLMLEGVTPENARGLKDGLESRGQRLSFTIEDPPSAGANQQLLDRDFLGVTSKCSDKVDVEGIVRPGDKACWQSRSLFAKYDVVKQPAIIKSIISNLDSLLDAVDEDMDAMILLMPESSRTAGSREWTSQQPVASDLRRRQFETVLGEKLPKKSQDSPTEFHASSSQSSGFSPLAAGPAAAQRRIPACFASVAACNNATNGCSGHGECRNKFTGTNASVADGKSVCFSCFCLPTKEGNSTRTFWGGKTCQKKDVSTPFWLLTGITVALVGMVSLSVGMLFSVGEEKLPGVIGAGVSRTTK